MGCGDICCEISVPFSWEVKPGISKYSNQHAVSDSDAMELPVPPSKPRLSLQESPFYLSEPDHLFPSSWEKPRVSVHELPVGLGLGALQKPPVMRNSSRKGLWKQEVDPFEVAYKVCTKTPTTTPWNRMLKKRHSIRQGRSKRGFFDFSCNHSCNVREDSIVKD
ncbi:hypothetical protein QQ045_022686 [Rhodiola kirilowii]